MSPVHSPIRPEAEPRKAPSNILLTKSEVVVGYLENLSLPSLGNRQLGTKDYEAWDKLLEPYSKGAVSFAFETWIRNNASTRAFPQPGVIIQLAKSYQEQEVDAKKYHPCGRCYDGWLYSRDDPGRYRLGVKRCPCFTAWVERKKAA